MTSQIQMEERHYQIVKKILNHYNVKVMVFGSRAKGTAKKFSDLDLVLLDSIEGKKLISIKSDLEDSNLPYKVDIIQWNELDQNFQRHIKNDLKEF